MLERCHARLPAPPAAPSAAAYSAAPRQPHDLRRGVAQGFSRKCRPLPDGRTRAPRSRSRPTRPPRSRRRSSKALRPNVFPCRRPRRTRRSSSTRDSPQARHQFRGANHPDHHRADGEPGRDPDTPPTLPRPASRSSPVAIRSQLPNTRHSSSRTSPSSPGTPRTSWRSYTANIVSKEDNVAAGRVQDRTRRG